MEQLITSSAIRRFAYTISKNAKDVFWTSMEAYHIELDCNKPVRLANLHFLYDPIENPEGGIKVVPQVHCFLKGEGKHANEAFFGYFPMNLREGYVFWNENLFSVLNSYPCYTEEFSSFLNLGGAYLVKTHQHLPNERIARFCGIMPKDTGLATDISDHLTSNLGHNIALFESNLNRFII